MATDLRAAAVFEHVGIDYCCGGRRSFADACRTASADPPAVMGALDAMPSVIDGEADVTQWPTARLIDHIVSRDHLPLTRLTGRH